MAFSKTHDSSWLVGASFISIFTILGFGLLAAGSVKFKGVQSSVISVFLASIEAILAFWLIGYALAFGTDLKQFIGASKFAAQGFEVEAHNDYADFGVQVVGAIIAVAIFSFGTLERAKFLSFSIVVFFLAAVLYPIQAHWVQGEGWLLKLGFVDFAGSGTIHVLGGTTALVATLILKHRRDRDGRIDTAHPHYSPLYIGLGSIILTVTLTAYAAANEYGGSDEGYARALIIVNSLIAGAFGGLTAFAVNYLRREVTSLIVLARGIIAGVVAVAASVETVRPWAAGLIGFFAGFTYLLVAVLVQKVKVDDPGQVIAQHLGAGAIGLLLQGILNDETGLLYGNSLKAFGFQIVGLLAIFGWGLLSALFLIPLKGFGLLKISQLAENEGIDKAYGGGEAIVFEDQGDGLLVNAGKKSIFS
ncbi:hypothetical protein pb186bvf_005273 [Paramecium bursaria]